MDPRIVSVLLASLLLANAAPSHKATAPECVDCLAAGYAIEDLNVLCSRLQEEHVDLFARRSRAAYGAQLPRLKASIVGPVTRAAFHLGFKDAMANGQFGHAKTEAAIAAVMVGERVTVDVPEVQPITADALDGKVWVLIDQPSFSNAAVVAALVQDLGTATLLGEETADLVTTYGAVERFSLPNSGAEIVYPKAYMVRHSGNESVHGVVPDSPFEPNPIGKARHLMLEAAVALAPETD